MVCCSSRYVDEKKKSKKQSEAVFSPGMLVTRFYLYKIILDERSFKVRTRSINVYIAYTLAKTCFLMPNCLILEKCIFAHNLVKFARRLLWGFIFYAVYMHV